ncbi:GNAT family N-acetyltransferase [Arthrobacter sp. HY1533]|uniref:GNAT family N-acetyltransferase n=1 Tax=Arthrobacter sp. HY1533 TaxID=2970919 RepID=UPI0022BA03A5|nr:GNAT family N-acetyltransferase [Arthrobacter sp. HY1533]
MLEIPYPLSTERLVLRRFTTADLDAYYDYQRLPETARYLYGEARSYAQCMARIGRYVEEPFNGPGDWATFAVELKSAPGLIGEMALKWNTGGKPEGPVPERFGEIGWTMAPAAQGHGYATEAARAVLELALDRLGFRRVEARLDARNTASAAICERLGMAHEGVMRDNMYLKGEWTSEAVYATVRGS